MYTTINIGFILFAIIDVYMGNLETKTTVGSPRQHTNEHNHVHMYIPSQHETSQGGLKDWASVADGGPTLGQRHLSVGQIHFYIPLYVM